jgi:hypothetical protein
VPKTEVKGKREVVQAFSRLSSDMEDLTDENTDLAGKIVGDVKRNTRKRTGTLADSWIASGDPSHILFSNPQKYAPVQEFGSDRRSIDPTNAVKKAFEDNTNAITDGYADGTRKRAKRRHIATA